MNIMVKDIYRSMLLKNYNKIWVKSYTEYGIKWAGD